MSNQEEPTVVDKAYLESRKEGFYITKNLLYIADEKFLYYRDRGNVLFELDHIDYLDIQDAIKTTILFEKMFLEHEEGYPVWHGTYEFLSEYQALVKNAKSLFDADRRPWQKARTLKFAQDLHAIRPDMFTEDEKKNILIDKLAD